MVLTSDYLATSLKRSIRRVTAPCHSSELYDPGELDRCIAEAVDSFLALSDGSVPTLFAVKSLIVKPSYLTQPALDYNHLLRSIRVLNLIWHGTKLPRQRSSMFYQDFLHPHRGKQHIVELFDTFVNVPVPTIEIPRHCALLELLGPSLSEMRTARQLEVGVVKEATRQVLLALDFLRTQCGMLYLGESYK
jgi:hypothetical protein